ncbi:hypothetical protein RQP46_009991 [Phenoliferia psychrophenolica]
MSDIEKGDKDGLDVDVDQRVATGVDKEAEARPELVFEGKYGGRAAGVMKALFSMGVEARGIERVPEDQRVPKGAFDNTWMWFSVNAVLTTVPIGVLGQEFFTLTLPHAIATILCFAALGCACTAFISTLGPQTGLRTMVISRYSGGFAGGIIFSILNILTQLGFSVTCVILGGQTLASVNGVLPLAAGVVIVSVCSLIICFFGYEYLHHWERYAWIVLTCIFCMIYGLGSEGGYDISAQKASEDVGRNLAGDVLSFGGIVFGSCSGWAPVAADYNVKLPANTSTHRVFWLTFIGLFIPICFVEILGATLMTITDPAYTAAFEEGSTGGLLAQVLSPWGGFGKFLLVLLGLSVISNNVPNTYSAALSIQTLWKPFERIPRLAEEHFMFRQPGGRLGGYDLEGYNSPTSLPPGYACIFAICCGIAGAVVGMAETYYTGPIALLVAKPYGGDLGFEFSAVFSGIVYPIARYFEIKHFGR